MTARITAWECIGCGRIEGAQPCIGVCQDRRTEFVHASDHDALVARLERSQRRTEALGAIVRQIACTTPRPGQCEHTWSALQERARRTLDEAADEA